jgi:hypothetical protein
MIGETQAFSGQLSAVGRKRTKKIQAVAMDIRQKADR